MARKALISFGGVIVVFLGVILARPSHVTIERQATIAAPQDLVFSYVGDLHNWEQWSAWEKLDPAMARTFSGPATGVGAKYAWSGNDRIGEGSFTVAQSTPPSSLKLDVVLVRPRPATNVMTFNLSTVGDATIVASRIELTHGFTEKAMSLVLDANKSLGTDLEQGLGELKFVAESEAARRAAPPEEPTPEPEGADAGAPEDAGAH